MEVIKYCQHVSDVRKAQYRERMAAQRIILSNGRVVHYVINWEGLRILCATNAPFDLTEDEYQEAMRKMQKC